MTVDDHVASTDLQNPADALEFLAHVAERDSSVNHLPPMQNSVFSRPRASATPGGASSRMESGRPQYESRDSQVIEYPPLAKGQLSLELLHQLLAR